MLWATTQFKSELNGHVWNWAPPPSPYLPTTTLREWFAGFVLLSGGWVGVGTFSAGWLLPAGNCVRIYASFPSGCLGLPEDYQSCSLCGMPDNHRYSPLHKGSRQPTAWLVPLNLLLFINRIDMIVDVEYALAGPKSVLGNCISHKGTHRTPPYPVRHSV